MKLRLRLSSIFFLVNSVILLLPVAAVVLLKLYNNTLIHQTENTLFAQAVMISNIYKKTLRENYPDLALAQYGHSLPQQHWNKYDPALGKWRPITAHFKLQQHSVLPKAAPPIATTISADPIALEIGRNLEEVLKETQLTTLAGMRILDMNGIIVATTAAVREQSLLHRIDVVSALQGNTELVLRQRKEKIEGSFFSPISRSTSIRVYITHPIVMNKRILGVVQLVRTPPNVYQTIYQNNEIFVYYGALILTLTILLSLFMSYAINRPIKALVNQAKKATDSSRVRLKPLEQPVTVEFETLSNTLVEMADRQAKRAEQISNFASYVSHEFKTPLTSINGAIDILQQHGNTLSELQAQKFLNNIVQSTERMQLLMQQLTVLAKADTAVISTTPVDLSQVIQEKVADYQRHFRHIKVFKRNNRYPIYMNRELIASVLINLLDNARQHGGDEVIIHVDNKHQQTCLRIIDNGPGITEANARRIFEPFFTTARHTGGTGLGLAILATLMNAHHGSIVLIPQQQGCCFELTFPSSEEQPPSH